MAVYPNPLNRTYLQGVIQARPDNEALRRNYAGLTILPAENVTEWDLTWDVVQAENNLAGIYAINGKPVPGSDVSFSQMFATVQTIAAMRIVDPVAVFNMRDAGEVSVTSRADQSAYDRAKRAVKRALEQCDDEVDATIEYMIMSALQGQIIWPPRDSSGNIITNKMPQWGEGEFIMTFPFRTEFIQKASTLTGVDSRAGGHVVWSNSGAKILQDLEVIAQLITRTTGLPARGSTLLMSSDVLSYMAFNSDLVSRITYTESSIKFIDTGKLKEFLMDGMGFKVVEYDAQWTYRTNVASSSGPTINRVPFLKPGRVIVLPPGENFGNFAVAPTPAPDNEYVNGKMVWTSTNPEPGFETKLGVTITGFPVLKAADSIFVFDSFE